MGGEGSGSDLRPGPLFGESLLEGEEEGEGRRAQLAGQECAGPSSCLGEGRAGCLSGQSGGPRA